MTDVPFTEEELHNLYLWVDSIPISRPKKNIARDFSDGCCVAEILHHFFPKMVELHNYASSMSRARKVENWKTLNSRVFSKIYFTVPPDEVEDLVAAVPGAIERFLRSLRIKIDQIRQHQETIPKKPQAAFREVNATKQSPARTSPAAQSVPAASPRGLQNSAPAASSRKKNEHKARYIDPSTSEAVNAYGEMLLDERGRSIAELKETVAILTEKIMKLEELIQIKDEKLNQYRAKFGRA